MHRQVKNAKYVKADVDNQKLEKLENKMDKVKMTKENNELDSVVAIGRLQKAKVFIAASCLWFGGLFSILPCKNTQDGCLKEAQTKQTRVKRPRSWPRCAGPGPGGPKRHKQGNLE